MFTSKVGSLTLSMKDKLEGYKQEKDAPITMAINMYVCTRYILSQPNKSSINCIPNKDPIIGTKKVINTSGVCQNSLSFKHPYRIKNAGITFAVRYRIVNIVTAPNCHQFTKATKPRSKT